MPKMNYDTEGGSVALQFFGQIGPEMLKLINLHGFLPTGKEFSNRFRKPYFSEEEKEQLIWAAKDMKIRYASGKREYCKELLIPTKQRVKHG
jgi:hypothetical protein